MFDDCSPSSWFLTLLSRCPSCLLLICCALQVTVNGTFLTATAGYADFSVVGSCADATLQASTQASMFLLCRHMHALHTPRRCMKVAIPRRLPLMQPPQLPVLIIQPLSLLPLLLSQPPPLPLLHSTQILQEAGWQVAGVSCSLNPATRVSMVGCKRSRPVWYMCLNSGMLQCKC